MKSFFFLWGCLCASVTLQQEQGLGSSVTSSSRQIPKWRHPQDTPKTGRGNRKFCSVLECPPCAPELLQLNPSHQTFPAPCQALQLCSSPFPLCLLRSLFPERVLDLSFFLISLPRLLCHAKHLGQGGCKMWLKIVFELSWHTGLLILAEAWGGGRVDLKVRIYSSSKVHNVNLHFKVS